MTETFMANGKELHPDMQPMMDARDAAGPAVTVEEQRAAWTAYSNKLSEPHPADMTVDDRTLSCSHGGGPYASIAPREPRRRHHASSIPMVADS